MIAEKVGANGFTAVMDGLAMTIRHLLEWHISVFAYDIFDETAPNTAHNVEFAEYETLARSIIDMYHPSLFLLDLVNKHGVEMKPEWLSVINVLTVINGRWHNDPVTPVHEIETKRPYVQMALF